MFSCCRDTEALTGILNNTYVVSATVDKSRTAMQLSLLLPGPVAPVDIALIEEGVKAEFGLSSVSIAPIYPRSENPVRKSESKKRGNPVIYGKEPGGSITPMDSVTLDLGKVTVRGEVFDVQSRDIPKRNAWVLNFDMTDYTGSVRISKFMTEDNAAEVVGRIKKGMYLTVSGNLGFNRYDGEVTIDPSGIALAEREVRQDTAEEKRVELHLHTKMSAMDAVIDTTDVVKRAIEWGTPPSPSRTTVSSSRFPTP
jgi:DNA polymerase-3 subunit alpha (Gram-positive type)